ncbi:MULTISPECIES: lycopene cyclase family protein [Streptomyces]|uniref:Lycopene cyclase n=1 Tax=Streptomyces rutgersensis TaxID=53451 RepID=A0ABX6RH78_9ACTN|nr:MULTISPECIES: lycopene cyclase family protein [Streptomyces]PJM82774.1 lycopene cyclase [Streptomyces sp. TSRI0384-2]QNE80025.1 lycopene cyclase [Streptomyces rutgersensis]
MDAEIVIVGAGAAGLSLAHHLCAPPPGARAPSVALVEPPPGPRSPAVRTWCHWGPPDGPYDAVLTASWDRLRVRDRAGRASVGVPRGLRYKMLRSDVFERFVLDGLGGRAGFVRETATVTGVAGGPGGAVVEGRDAHGRPYRRTARWVFDSRPPDALPPARTTLLQHFRGWFVRTAEPRFDTGCADLMDFRTPQPAHGLSFGYVLPLGPCRALVEYTEFSRAPLDDAGYEAALRGYTGEVLRLGAFEVTGTEQGVIPMTDARFPRTGAPGVFRVGTAGGATRPSTGYTFAAVQRQARHVADRYRRGLPPVPPAPHSRRSRAMDAVLLRALDRRRVDGAAFFARLFATLPPERVLTFLDGGTGLREDLAIGCHVPWWPMTRTALELPFLRRRPAGAPPHRGEK